MSISQNQFTNPWKKEEIKILKDKWGKCLRGEIQELLPNRTWSSIGKKAYDLNLKKEPGMRGIAISAGTRSVKSEKKQSLLDEEQIYESEEFRPNTDILLPKNKFFKTVVVADIHIPFQDNLLIDLFYEFLKDEKPDYLILGGDIIDCFQLSSFRRIPLDKVGFQDELGQAKKFFKKIRDIIPEAVIYYIEGNHEFRLRKYLIDQAKELYFVPTLRLSYLLDCDKYKIIYVPCKRELNKFSHNYINFNGICIGHFDKVLKNAGYTARMLRDEIGISLIQTHIHRTGMSSRTFVDGVRIGWEIGCMCQNPTYQTLPDWQRGFGVLFTRGSNYMFYPIVIDDYQFIAPNGKEYRVH